MRKLWLIIKREYLTRVCTKGFVIGTIALPLFTVGMFVFTVFMATRQVSHTLKLAILDNAGGLAAGVARGLKGKLPDGRPVFQVVEAVVKPRSEEEAREQLRTRIRSSQLDGYLVIPKDVYAGNAAEFHTKNPGDFTLTPSLARAVSDAVIARRLEDRGIHLENWSEAIRGVDIKLIKVSKEGESEEKGQSFVLAMVMTMLLYTTLVMYGIVTMRSVLEEKTTRIVEVLVSSVRPFQLMAGKVLGVAAVAFTQYLIWIVSGALLVAYGATMAAAIRPGVSMPAFHIPAILLVYLALFFLAGYFLYASLYAAIGAAASSEQDAQQLQWPATVPLIASVVMINLILRDPNSTASAVLSEIPFFAPVIMLSRIASQTPPFWQIALSIFLLVLTTAAVVYFSAKIYRVGVLMYGKRPSLVEVLRWLRYT